MVAVGIRTGWLVKWLSELLSDHKLPPKVAPCRGQALALIGNSPDCVVLRLCLIFTQGCSRRCWDQWALVVPSRLLLFHHTDVVSSNWSIELSRKFTSMYASFIALAILPSEHLDGLGTVHLCVGAMIHDGNRPHIRSSKYSHSRRFVGFPALLGCL